MSQNNDIYQYMYTQGSITPLEALHKLGCFRLASRITELRQKGIHIKTIMIEDNGKKYAKYILEN